MNFFLFRTRNKRSRIPLELLTKMQNICTSCSTSLKALFGDLVSLILHEIFSLLVCIGIAKIKNFSSSSTSGKLSKVFYYQRLLHHSLKRNTNWEMRRTLVCAPEMTPTYDCGALLLGAVLIFYLKKKRIKLRLNSIKSSNRLVNTMYYLCLSLIFGMFFLGIQKCLVVALKKIL